MAIAPIMNAKVASGNVNFQGRKKKQEQDTVSQNPISNKASSMVTVPVAVLMALATTSLNANPANSKAPADSEIQTEMAVQSTSETEAPQQKTQTTVKKNQNYYKALNFGTNLATYEIVNKPNSLKSGRRPFTMVFEEFRDNEVGSVVLFPYDKKDDFDDEYYVCALVQHTPLEGNEFYGVIAVGRDENGKVVKFELQVPKKVADEIYNLIQGTSPYKNGALSTDGGYFPTEKSSLLNKSDIELYDSVFHFTEY